MRGSMVGPAVARSRATWSRPVRDQMDEDGLFTADGPLAGRALSSDQPPVQNPGGLVHGISQFALQPHIAPLRVEITADGHGQAGRSE